MEKLRENYPAPAFYGAMNFLSTTTPKAFDDSGPHLPPRRRRATSAPVYHLSDSDLRAACAACSRFPDPLHLSPGSPIIYYGDEAGMQGFEDPFNRGTYPWGRENAEVVQYFQQLGALRKSHRRCKAARSSTMPRRGRALAFSRRTESTTASRQSMRATSPSRSPFRGTARSPRTPCPIRSSSAATACFA